jgi:hypothetical protein
MEDRFSAIRAAIGTAGAGDAVIIAGRGHLDFMEYGDEEVGPHCSSRSRTPGSALIAFSQRCMMRLSAV